MSSFSITVYTAALGAPVGAASGSLRGPALVPTVGYHLTVDRHGAAGIVAVYVPAGPSTMGTVVNAPPSTEYAMTPLLGTRATTSDVTATRNVVVEMGENAAGRPSG